MARVRTRQRRGALPAADVAATVNHIRRLERGLRLIAREIELSTGASAAQLFVLEQLAGDPALSLSDLAVRTFTDRSSVSEVVDRLVASGLATRRISPSDRRRAEVSITETGRSALAASPTTPAQRLIVAISKLPARTRRQLESGLGRMNAALGLDSGRPRLLFEETERERHSALGGRSSRVAR